MKYDGIIFDKDGVLLDSGINRFQWMDQIRVEKAREMGLEFSIEDSHRVVHSKDRKDIEKFLKEKDMTWQQLADMERSIMQKKKEKIENGEISIFEDVKKVLESLEREKAVVSNAPNEITQFTVDYFDLRQFFQTVKAPSINDYGRYIQRKKPNPEMINQTIDEAGFENPIMIGDTSADIGAANRAGIDSIHVDTYGFSADNATYQVKKLGDILSIVQ